MPTFDCRINADAIFHDLELIRSNSPLIHNITNYVVMNSTANALLAIGASPIMAHAREELVELLSACSALVINIGTLDEKWIESMSEAIFLANKHNIPIIIDPVGAGATTLRTQISKQLIKSAKRCIVRGNASEIFALADEKYTTKGVDSTHSGSEAVHAAQQLAAQTGHTIVISGATDYCIDSSNITTFSNGSSLMQKVTGMGCMSTAITAAFAAVNNNKFEAAAHAIAVMGVVGELAATTYNAPGQFSVAFIDQLYLLDKQNIKSTLKVNSHATC